MTEKLINHIGIVQMDGNYFAPTMEKMFEAYKKVIPELLIDQTKKQELKIKRLEKTQIELEKFKEDSVLLLKETREEFEEFRKRKEELLEKINLIKLLPKKDKQLIREKIANLKRERKNAL